jgi:hypothetical protein
LLLKDVENAARRVAALELGSEWVGEKVLLCSLFVGFQGVIENKLKVGGWGGSSVSVRHIGQRARRRIARWVIGKEKGNAPEERVRSAFHR